MRYLRRPAARGLVPCRWPVLLAAAALLAAACSGGGGPGKTASPSAPGSAGPLATSPPAGTNLLVNGGFEDGPEPWITLAPESGFEITQEQAHSGSSAAVLRMHDPAEAQGAKVYYLVQEISPKEMPEVVRGYYRVENWHRGTVRQYLQFVIIAFNPTNFPNNVSNYQIRYPLAGIDSPPFDISNAYFVFVTRKDPAVGEWVPFEVHPKADFQKYWGKVPEGFTKLRLLFEVRWDGKVAGDGAPSADVYYDDLYVGN